jgi:hypothetical protein
MEAEVAAFTRRCILSANRIASPSIANIVPDRREIANGRLARELEQEADAQRNMTEEERRKNAEIERLRAVAMEAATTALRMALSISRAGI